MLKFENYKMTDKKILNIKEHYYQEMKSYCSVRFAAGIKNICLVSESELSKIPNTIHYEILDKLNLTITLEYSEAYPLAAIIANCKSISITVTDFDIPKELIEEIKEKTNLILVKSRDRIHHFIMENMNSTRFDNINSEVFDKIILLEDLLADNNENDINASKHIHLVCVMEGK